MALATKEWLSLECAEQELAKRRARQSLLPFIQYCWSAPDPFLLGLHTKIITERLDRAIEDFQKGKSTFLLAMMPVGHGKSEVISRHLPPYFLGKCSAHEPGVISTGYGSDLVQSFSRKAKGILRSDEYRELFPHVRMCDDKRSDANWQVQYQNQKGLWHNSNQEIVVAGLGGPITGRRYHLGLVDDFCKGREDAESPRIRDKTWNSFKEDFLSRRHPKGSITIVTATPWHVDDVIGRIKKAMQDDPKFPHFEIYVFPAMGPGNANGEVIDYPQPYLFLEFFPEEWYVTQRASFGKYGAAGLLDCDPQQHSGDLFDMTRINVHKNLSDFPDTQYVRFWDLASTDKERLKDDPDFTCGALCGVTKSGVVPHFWVKDIVMGQWSAGKRADKILATTERDGGEVKILVEQVGGYKDAVDMLKEIMAGFREVIGVPVSVNKVVRANALEPVFEAGNVHILEAAWNKDFYEQVSPFPFGDHDDIPDAIIGAYRHLDKPEDGYFGFSTFNVMPED